MKSGENVIATRRQFPLRLAWGITAHKSQGLTIDRVSMNLAKVFERGQGYVAVSRARTLAGLNIKAWDEGRTFRAHPEVRAFADRMRVANGAVVGGGA